MRPSERPLWMLQMMEAINSEDLMSVLAMSAVRAQIYRSVKIQTFNFHPEMWETLISSGGKKKRLRCSWVHFWEFIHSGSSSGKDLGEKRQRRQGGLTPKVKKQNKMAAAAMCYFFLFFSELKEAAIFSSSREAGEPAGARLERKRE